jgi:hypothetical protein
MQMQAPEPRKKIFTEPHEVNARVQELGLIPEILRHAVEAGIAGFNACTSHHPRTYAGLRGWAEAVKDLRDSLTPIPYEWHPEEPRNLPFVVNKNQSVAIMVATGDSATGRESGSPCTNSSKGPVTKSAIECNAVQFELFPEPHLTPEELEKHRKMGRMTFLLLMYRDSAIQEVRCELSRPAAMDENDRVTGWIERIILKPLPFNGQIHDIVPDVPQTPEIDVKVKKRA